MIRTDLHAIYYEGLLSETHHEEGCALSGVTSISSSFILMKMFSDKLDISAVSLPPTFRNIPSKGHVLLSCHTILPPFVVVCGRGIISMR